MTALPFKNLTLSLLTLSLFLHSTTSLPATTTIGVTYTPSPNLPPPEQVATALQSLHISAVSLPSPTPEVVRAFSYSNISLLLSIPNHLISSFATNRSAASLWLYTHVVPFYPRSHISTISVGNDAISTSSSYPTDLLPAMRNVHLSLRDLGIKNVAVSTTFSFIDVMTTSFPPSSAEFQEPIHELVLRPLLQFLEETNSSFLIKLYPYNVFKLNSEVPLGYALFQENPFNFRDDDLTGVRYRNLFDMMVDAVIAAMAVSGHENIPLIVTETGWPCSSDPNEAQAYTEMYLKGLISHLRSGLGTPLRKEGVAQTYIYQLFDDGDVKNGSERDPHWGILYPNLTMKYHIAFSDSERVHGNRGRIGMILGLLLGVLLLQ
ncbi:unnamed protein product [Ilex paraguariensis]|uniref:Glucan endo-1,3-beta-D-glucosidase n=1 Tax=Ilex paraguariensis TaxID=185542 RepID=A0ABC8QSM6_9AQUA